MKADKEYWYPLDGQWHASVANRLSTLHLMAGEEYKGGALCKPTTTCLLEDDGYTKEEAIAAHRTLCKRCLNKSSRTQTGSAE